MNDLQRNQCIFLNTMWEMTANSFLQPLSLYPHWEVGPLPLPPWIWARPETALSHRLWQKWHWANSRSDLQEDWKLHFLPLRTVAMLWISQGASGEDHMQESWGSQLTLQLSNQPHAGLTCQPFECATLDVALPAPADSMWGKWERSLLSLAQTAKSISK